MCNIDQERVGRGKIDELTSEDTLLIDPMNSGSRRSTSQMELGSKISRV